MSEWRYGAGLESFFLRSGKGADLFKGFKVGGLLCVVRLVESQAPLIDSSHG